MINEILWADLGGGVETARVFFGLSAALSMPWGTGWQRTRPWLAVSFVTLYGVYVIAPYMDEAKAWWAFAIAVLLVGGSALMHHSAGSWSPGFSLTLPLSSGASMAARRVGVVLMALAAVLALWTAGRKTATLSGEFLLSDRAAIFLSALLLAVFGGGALSRAATAPVCAEVESMPDGPEKTKALDFMSGSKNIGLLERGLLFVFIAAGQPEAAALVLAAKSLARVPTNDHGKHASEYFLIGTLASVIASLVMGMAARSAVGLSVL
ncbi:hypothetical protein ABT282_14950 [Streptomyces sp. NPDC000927]|uniref:hypothetical protein n=1 Tax=Streptomyces sp. NPDC000927 TaxID=3154371 RepID=UPI003333269A